MAQQEAKRISPFSNLFRREAVASTPQEWQSVMKDALNGLPLERLRGGKANITVQNPEGLYVAHLDFGRKSPHSRTAVVVGENKVHVLITRLTPGDKEHADSHRWELVSGIGEGKLRQNLMRDIKGAKRHNPDGERTWEGLTPEIPEILTAVKDAQNKIT